MMISCFVSIISFLKRIYFENHNSLRRRSAAMRFIIKIIVKFYSKILIIRDLEFKISHRTES